MRYLLMSVGKFQFFDEPSKGFIGGKIIAINPDTKEEKAYTYKRFHTGKTDKFSILAKAIYDLEPPQEQEKKVDKEKNF